MNSIELAKPAASGNAWSIRRARDFILESGLVAGGVSVVALLAFVFAWQLHLSVSLLFALGLYFGVTLLVPARSLDSLVVDGLSADEFQRLVADRRVKLARIEQAAQRIGTPEAFRSCFSVIVHTAVRILHDFEECPRHLQDARFAFDTLLNATQLALDRYHKFEGAGGAAAQRGLQLLQDRVFPTALQGFQQLLDQLLRDDLRALNVDVVVLEQMLELEGLAIDITTLQKESAT